MITRTCFIPDNLATELALSLQDAQPPARDFLGCAKLIQLNEFNLIQDSYNVIITFFFFFLLKKK